MPLEGLDEEGLPKNPDLSLVELKFLLTVDDGFSVNKEEVWAKLLASVEENGTGHTHTLMQFVPTILPHTLRVLYLEESIHRALRKTSNS